MISMSKCCLCFGVIFIHIGIFNFKISYRLPFPFTRCDTEKLVKFLFFIFLHRFLNSICICLFVLFRFFSFHSVFILFFICHSLLHGAYTQFSSGTRTWTEKRIWNRIRLTQLWMRRNTQLLCMLGFCEDRAAREWQNNAPCTSFFLFL